MSTTPTHIARYTVVQPIAAGGMGEVFLARDDQLDRLVAIKLLRDGFDSEELRGRFEEEARNVAKLTHPNIVTIYEYGAHEGRPYIAMEYVAGHSLADLIRGRMPLPLARRVRLMEELCSGLSHAHKAHLVHRDVKPANLMVTTSGMLKVLDFGIAKLRGSDRTQAGMLVGTVNYMSPEQITGQPVDHRSDIFAVGLVLHEVLAYDQAFKGDLTSAMFNIVHGQPEPLAVRCPGLDPGFQAVVNRCLAKRPEDRYHDLNLLKRDLARLRKPLEDDDTELADTIGLLNDDKTAVVPRTAPSTATQVKTAVGPDTRRALASAVAAGEAAIARGQFESAERHAEQALALEAGDAAARELLDRARRASDAAKVASQVGHAREALQADRLDDARTALTTAAQLAPGSNTVRELAAQVERRAADLARFTEAVRDAREHLGERDFDGARRLAETAVLIRPDDSDIQRLRAQIDEAAAAEARRIEAATREAERLAQEAERLAEEQVEADAERVAQEQRRAEAERVEREQRQAEAAMQAASAAASDATPDASRDAVTLTQRAYWDEPTQTLEVLDTRVPTVVPPTAPARQPFSDSVHGRVDDARTQPAARPAVRPAVASRPVLMAIGGATAVAVAVLVWAMRPASAPDSPPDTPPAVAPSGASAPAAEPTLAATPRGDAGALTGFQSPLESQPAGSEPAVVPTPGGVARPAAPSSPAAPGAGASVSGSGSGSGSGTGGASRPGAVIPPTTGAVPRPNTPLPVSAPPPVSVAPAGGSGTATPPVATGANPSGATTPATGPAIPTTGSVSPTAGTSASASPATPPSGKAAAPPPAEAPGGRQLDETTITRLVNAFGQAYQSKDLPGLRAVWPEMRGSDENSYRNVFNSYRSISWVTGDTNIRFEGERADARSAVQVTQRALRPDTTTTQSRTYRFRFERRAKGWVLTGVENLGVAR